MRTLKILGVFLKLKVKELWEMKVIQWVLGILIVIYSTHFVSLIPCWKPVWEKERGGFYLYVRYGMTLAMMCLVVIILGFIYFILLPFIKRKICDYFIPWIKDNWKQATKIVDRESKKSGGKG